MKKYLLIFITILSCHVCFAHCQKGSVPRVIKPMANWDIIATNTATIRMKGVFRGSNLRYFIYAHPKNAHNTVKINKLTGIIHIKAEKKDRFNVTVKAKNKCGSTSNTFNVIIDEEE